MPALLATPRRCRRCGTVTVADYATACLGCGVSLRGAEVVEVAAQAPRRGAPSAVPVPPPPPMPTPEAPGTARGALERILEAKRRAEEAAEREEREEAAREQAEAPGGRPRRRFGLMSLFYVLFIAIAILNSLFSDKEARRKLNEWLGRGEKTERPREAPSEEPEPGGERADPLAAVKARAALEALGKTAEIYAFRHGRLPKDREEWLASREYRAVAPKLREQFADGADPGYEHLGRTVQGERYRVTARARDRAGTELSVVGLARTPPG